jgi:hypothetical protein
MIGDPKEAVIEIKAPIEIAVERVGESVPLAHLWGRLRIASVCKNYGRYLDFATEKMR